MIYIVLFEVYEDVILGTELIEIRYWQMYHGAVWLLVQVMACHLFYA